MHKGAALLFRAGLKLEPVDDHLWVKERKDDGRSEKTDAFNTLVRSFPVFELIPATSQIIFT